MTPTLGKRGPHSTSSKMQAESLTFLIVGTSYPILSIKIKLDTSWESEIRSKINFVKFILCISQQTFIKHLRNAMHCSRQGAHGSDKSESPLSRGLLQRGQAISKEVRKKEMGPFQVLIGAKGEITQAKTGGPPLNSQGWEALSERVMR